jgi:hypothetical protein
MEENRNIQNAFKNLPEHRPDEALWSRIDALLPVTGKTYFFTPLVNRLPKRQPSETLWYSIVRELDNRNRRKWIYLATLAAAALFAMYFGWDELMHDRKPVEQQQLISQGQAKKDVGIQPAVQKPATAVSVKKETDTAIKTTSLPGKGQHRIQKGKQPINPGIREEQRQLVQQGVIPDLTKQTGLPDSNRRIIQPATDLVVAQPLNPNPADTAKPLSAKTQPDKTFLQNVAATKVSPADSLKNKTIVVPPARKPENLLATKTPTPSPAGKLSVGVDYLSQPFNNGVNQTHLRNLNLSAILKKKKIRFYSGIGYAYASESSTGNRKDMMTYSGTSANASYTLVNASTSSPSALDAYSTAKNSLTDAATQQLFTSLVATPVPANHSFLYYDLGASSRLFGNDKISGWATAATGIAIKLDKKSSREIDIATINTILANNQSAYSIPYNNYQTVNLSVIAGFQLDYRIIKRFSLLVEPSARFYLVPLFDGYLNRSDSFSLGFRTGIKYDLK